MQKKTLQPKLFAISQQDVLKNDQERLRKKYNFKSSQSNSVKSQVTESSISSVNHERQITESKEEQNSFTENADRTLSCFNEFDYKEEYEINTKRSS